MSKSKTHYVCQSCGAVSPKWAGKCEACGAWNSFVAETIVAAPPKSLAGSKQKGTTLELVDLKGEQAKLHRYKTDIHEFDRVVGGGLVPGCALLLGGDPGIGKSTLLLQLVCQMALKNLSCVYVSGEEAVDQVRLRASRLGLEKAPVQLASATNVRDIISTMEQGNINILIIDSIQTMYVDTVDSSPGTVTQVRAAAQELIRVGKKLGIILVFVGHVTKDGQIAGPRVLEHMVDTVLYFEGDRGHHFRILRTVKNRFGPTDEIGVFEMAEQGLMEVLNPSALFLAQRRPNSTGSAVFAGLEGTRPILVEVQALVATNPYGSPRRAVIGWDTNRLAMILAVLESRCGLQFTGHDVYLNMAGGLKISEPAADLAVAAALVSALLDVAVPDQMVFFGEVGLSGEVRSVPQTELRLKEASKLGFEDAMMAPKVKSTTGAQAARANAADINIHEIDHLAVLCQSLKDGLVPQKSSKYGS
jgi:DNA repair protein RadA/Sms